MSGFLLDTNCVSEAVRIQPEPRVLAWMRANEAFLYVSVLTFGEIRKGITLLPGGRKRTELERWLTEDLPSQFSDRLLPINAEIAEVWGTITREARKGSGPLSRRRSRRRNRQTARSHTRDPQRKGFPEPGNIDPKSVGLALTA